MILGFLISIVSNSSEYEKSKIFNLMFATNFKFDTMILPSLKLAHKGVWNVERLNLLQSRKAYTRESILVERQACGFQLGKPPVLQNPDLAKFEIGTDMDGLGRRSGLRLKNNRQCFPSTGAGVEQYA